MSDSKYIIECDEIYSSRNIKTLHKIVKDTSHKVTSTSSICHDDANFKLVEKLKLFFYQAFLPQGFPQSVSDDYIEYQVWDTSQAFCSTLTAVLTTHTIMQGVGVGNESATALSAAIAWILKDLSGMVARIMFAWWKGTVLDSDCKRWRIVADLINDMAICFELMLPFFSQSYVVYILILSSIGKSLVGVAGGATRASITQHQARSGNIGDIAAKDGSQETCVNLTASLLGVLILKLTSDNFLATWIIFIILTGFHIYSNYKAVKCLKFNTLNRQRFLLIFKNYLKSKEISNFNEIRKQEKILFPISESYLFNININIGTSLKDLSISDACTSQYHENFITSMTSPKKNTLWERLKKSRCVYVNIYLKCNIDVKNILQAYCYAIFLQIKKNATPNCPNVKYFLQEMKYENEDEEFRQNYFEEFYSKLNRSDWDISHLNHFHIDDWRYDKMTQRLDKQKLQ